MGIAISLLMAAVYGAYVVVCGRWRRITYWLLCMTPPIVCGLGYFWIKKAKESCLPAGFCRLFA